MTNKLVDDIEPMENGSNTKNIICRRDAVKRIAVSCIAAASIIVGPFISNAGAGNPTSGIPRSNNLERDFYRSNYCSCSTYSSTHTVHSSYRAHASWYNLRTYNYYSYQSTVTYSSTTCIGC